MWLVGTILYDIALDNLVGKLRSEHLLLKVTAFKGQWQRSYLRINDNDY